MVLLQHKRQGFQIRFYSVHFTPGVDEKDERLHQAERVVTILLQQAKIGELPPILVGDFNCSRNFVTGTAENSIKLLERHFWRPIDSDNPNSTGIDVIYIGKKESFPYSNGDFETVSRHHVPMKKEPTSVDGVLLAQLTDHDSEGFILRIINFSSLPYIVWWEEKNFTGTRHKRTLHPFDHGKCLKLVHNNEMKSIKFYGFPGWKLYLFDSGECRTNDDWGLINFPNDPNVEVVEVPKIGRQGPGQCSPPGSYEFHYKDGLPGEVSAIKHTGP